MPMKVDFLRVLGSWQDIVDSARTTVGAKPSVNEPTPMWKRRILLAEHSPIRRLHIIWKWTQIKGWVSTHFVRHKFGIEHWVRTSRSDRTFIDRDGLSQSALVEHECEASAQAVINISRKRLCNQASPETREAWAKVIDQLFVHDPALAMVCVPDCVYRGWCYEFKSCGYHLTDTYQKELIKYREGINAHL